MKTKDRKRTVRWIAAAAVGMATTYIIISIAGSTRVIVYVAIFTGLLANLLANFVVDALQGD